MTGRELILYILENHLEDAEIFKDGKLVGTLTEKEAAAKLGIGSSAIHSMCAIRKLKALKIGEQYFIFPDSLGGVDEKENSIDDTYYRIGYIHTR